MRIDKTLAALVVAGSLVGCSTVNTVATSVNNLISAISSDAGQAFINALGVGGTVTNSIVSVITGIDSGISSPDVQKGLQTVCYALPWAEGALDAFAPMAHIDPGVVADTDTAVAAFLNGPCTNPPLNVADAITQGTNLYLSIVDALHTNGVPVAVPAHIRLMR